MLAWIFSNEEYTALYHEYFAEFLTMFFTDGAFEEMIDSVSEMIAPYIENQCGCSGIYSVYLLRYSIYLS